MVCIPDKVSLLFEALFLRTILIQTRSPLIIVSVVALASPLAGQAGGGGADAIPAARRIVAAASLAAREYGLGVVPGGGRVAAAEEVAEAKLFVDQARFDIPSLPARVRGTADSALTRLTDMFARLAPPDSVQRVADQLVVRLGVTEPLPSRPPSVELGASIYRVQCTPCHGATGRGDGPKAHSVKGPPPANLADPIGMGGTSLLEIFRRITVGTPGTAMPEFDNDLSEEERWAVAAYVATLPHGGSPSATLFAAVRRQVDSAVAERSDKRAFDAYLTFEQVETDVQARNPALGHGLEAAFTRLRTRAAVAGAAELAGIRQQLLADLERAERVVADRPSAMNLSVSSFFLMLREGFEAILVVAALMTFLAKAGEAERRREVARGAWLAVAASLITWVVVELLFRVTPGQREVLEGITMLVATAVLFYVSYWLLSKAQVARWNAFVKDKVQSALTSGSGFALSAVAFLAVYREGFETILFYKALFTSAGGAGTLPVTAGLVAGAAALVAVYVVIDRLGMRVAMKPFFAVTGAMLYYMAFVFAGKGVAELQSGGLLPLTVIDGAPRLPVLGIYPTLESLLVQGVLLALAVVALLAGLRLRPEAVERRLGPQLAPLGEQHGPEDH